MVLLMLSEEDAAFARAVELGRRACDAAVFAQCGQWDGTRHVTLFELQLSEEEAARVSFAKPLTLPLRLSLAGLQTWPNTLAVGLTDASDAALREALPALHGLPDGAPAVVGEKKKLHVTLFSMRRVSRDARDAAKAQLEHLTLTLTLSLSLTLTLTLTLTLRPAAAPHGG